MSITKEQLSIYVDAGLSTREIARKINKSQSNARVWLNKFNLVTKPKFKYQQDTKVCPKCDTEKPISDFYTKRDKLHPDKYTLSYCIICTSKQATDRQQNLKKLAIEYKGGKCVICGYNRCPSALDFHHLDPREKDFSISKSKNTSFDVVKAELDKCILLCCRCHRELHAGLHPNLEACVGVAPT